MKPPLEFAVAVALPIAAVYAVIGGGRLVKWLSDQPSRPDSPEPIEQLRANLVRLRAQLEDMETRSDQPAKNLRVRALRAAYVDRLLDACQRLDVSPPPAPARVRKASGRATSTGWRPHCWNAGSTSGNRPRADRARQPGRTTYDRCVLPVLAVSEEVPLVFIPAMPARPPGPTARSAPGITCWTSS